MLELKINDKTVHRVDLSGEGINLDGKSFAWDIKPLKPGNFHILVDHRSYLAEVIDYDAATKTFSLRINQNTYQVSVKDRYDQLLDQLGISNLADQQVKEIKAPMPGLVLDILVDEGAALKKEDSVLVLEAMKMENILKSPGEGVIKKINVKTGDAVEKNQVLLHME